MAVFRPAEYIDLFCWAWHSDKKMIALITIFITSFVLALSGALMPGPLLSTTISESMRTGASAGFWLMLGHALLEITLIVALLFGLAPLLTHDAFFITIALSGSLILAWMAFCMFRDLPGLHIDWESQDKPSGRLVPAGILVSLSNPYWSIWWATIGLGYILTCQAYGIPGIVFFFLGHIAADIAWYSLVSFLAAHGRNFLSTRRYRIIIAVCAGFLCLFAFYFLFAGLKKLLILIA